MLNLMTLAPSLHGNATVTSGMMIDGPVGGVTIKGDNSRYYGAGALTDSQI